MRATRHFRAAAAASLFSLALTACAGGPPAGAPRTVAARSAAEQQAGDQNHPQILQQFGGEVQDPAIRAYVDEIGRKLVRQTEQPGAKWKFTVLDSPVVNAFALPGGYVYVTRGLIALANDEAELAGVIGHEIGHVTAAHSANRQERSTLAQLGVLGAQVAGAVAGLSGPLLDMLGQASGAAGQAYVASYSRTQEFEADQLGVRYLAAAGYDPSAEADFLASLQAESTLQARIAGGQYNPNRVDFFASHPATAERVQEAQRQAGAAGQNTSAPRNRDRFLSVISGMTYGDNPEQGFVKGNEFIHPSLGFAFSAPSGFQIQNSASNVTMRGRSNDGVIFDGGDYPGGSMEDYIRSRWAPSIGQQMQTGELQSLSSGRIGGLESASALLPARTNNGPVVLHLTAIRDGDRVWRFFGFEPLSAGGVSQRIDLAAQSFRKLSASERGAVTAPRVTIHTVRAGETAESLAFETPFADYQVERFRVLNGLERGEALKPGDKVKLIKG